MSFIAENLTWLPGISMDALTLFLIVDICNRELTVTDKDDRPAIYQPYTDTYPQLISKAVLDQESECYAYKKPNWLKI